MALSPLGRNATLGVAVLHVGFFVLEALLWTNPTGRKIFRMKEDKAKQTQALAANQGVYNLALAVLMGWAALTPGQEQAVQAALGFVVFVGLFGAASVSRSILYVQAIPALAALAAIRYA